MNKFKIIVDSDACPFKNEIIDQAKKHGIELLLLFLETSQLSGICKKNYG